MGDTNADTELKLNLVGRDPDDGVTDIAYIKGCFFLKTIENAVGRPTWDSFVNKYFKTFAFQSITTEKFLVYLNHELIHDNNILKQKIRIDDWVYKMGIPSNCPNIISTELQKSERAAEDYMHPEKIDTKGWTTHHWLHFLRSFPMKVNTDDLARLDKNTNLANRAIAKFCATGFKLLSLTIMILRIMLWKNIYARLGVVNLYSPCMKNYWPIPKQKPWQMKFIKSPARLSFSCQSNY